MERKFCGKNIKTKLCIFYTHALHAFFTNMPVSKWGLTPRLTYWTYILYIYSKTFYIKSRKTLQQFRSFSACIVLIRTATNKCFLLSNQAALKTLTFATLNSTPVWKFLQFLNRIGPHNEATLAWVQNIFAGKVLVGHICA